MSDKELFDRIHRLIVEQQLFLNPSFSRKHYLELGLINKNKAAQLLQLYAHTHLTGYINKLRLDYAVHYMDEHPDDPIKPVALSSGFQNIRTFYRLFLAEFGVTPTTYKNQK